MGKIISNGIEYVGLTNINGVFIDTNNVIDSGSYSGTLTYTATEDCFFTGVVTCKATGAGITSYMLINGEQIYSVVNPSNDVQFSAFVKKGQIVTLFESGTTTNFYSVYGVQQGSTSQGSSGGIDYSTTEQKTGQKWIDGKDIYQKTYVTITDTQYGSENAYLIGTIPNGLDNVIDFEGSLKTSDGVGYSSLNGIGSITQWNFGIHISNTNLLLYGGNNLSSMPQNATCIVTIKYTKSTT